MNKEIKAYIDLARLLESEFYAKQDAGILANLNKKNIAGLHVTREKILNDMREQLKDYSFEQENQGEPQESFSEILKKIKDKLPKKQDGNE